MSAPLIWIVFPVAAALGLFFIRRRTMLTASLAAGLCLGLTVLVEIMPPGSVVDLGVARLPIDPVFSVLGRRFVLGSGDQAVISLVYGFAAAWFVGSAVFGSHRYFVPFALAITALLVAAVAVEPFMYAALLVEMAVLMSVPLLAPPGQPMRQGVLRYLIFQTLAVPCILVAGWAASAIEANPAQEAFLQMAVVLLALGLCLWLAAFPFYTWVPLLAGEVNPLVSGFILTLFPVAALLLALDFLNAFSWLRLYPLLPQTLRTLGVLMVVIGGVWAAFEQNAARLLGYGVVFENGFALIALSLSNQGGLPLLAVSFLPRMAVMSLWSFSVGFLWQQSGDLRLEALAGMLRRAPWPSLGLLAAVFSLGGLPLLASFPVHQALLERLGGVSVGAAVWAAAGSAAFLVGGFRLLNALVKVSPPDSAPLRMNWPQRVLMAVGIAVLLLVGWFPGWLSNGLIQILQAFERLL